MCIWELHARASKIETLRSLLMHRRDKKQTSKKLERGPSTVYITLERLYLNSSIYNVVYSYVNIVIFGLLSKRLKQVVYACTYLGFGCLPWTLTSLHVKDSKTDKTNSQFLQLSMRDSAPSQPHGKNFRHRNLMHSLQFQGQ